MHMSVFMYVRTKAELIAKNEFSRHLAEVKGAQILLEKWQMEMQKKRIEPSLFVTSIIKYTRFVYLKIDDYISEVLFQKESKYRLAFRYQVVIGPKGEDGKEQSFVSVEVYCEKTEKKRHDGPFDVLDPSVLAK